MAESYLTFFHIVESDKSLEWLDKNWDDDAHFIYYEPRSEYNESVIGNRYCGQRIRYVNCPEDIDARGTLMDNPGLAVVLLDQETFSMTSTEQKQRYYTECMEALAPLFNRIVTEKFNESENEFRILSRGMRRVADGLIQVEAHNPVHIRCAGNEYEVNLTSNKNAEAQIQSALGICVKNYSDSTWLPLEAIICKDSHPTICKNIYNLDVRDTAIRYGYIGGKKECETFIKKELSGIDTFQDNGNHHRHQGKWHNYLTRRVHQHNEVAVIISPPEKGYYTWTGKGFKEMFLAAPTELGYTTPEESYTACLKAVTEEHIKEQRFGVPF